MAILELEGVEKRFGAVTVADGVTFDVGEGDALGIIGPNGAGKSSLFNLITGNLPADGGQIRFLGEDVTHVSAMRRCHAGMGRTFQIPQPFQQLTVFENLLVGAAFGSSRSEAQVSRRCAEILEETGLVERANQPAGSLSLLQRKRLELARALATEPKILLLDEIAGGLTEHECTALVETIRNIHASGVAIVWIEHVLHALNAVVGRLLVLDFGKIIGIGPVDEIMASDAVRDIYLGIEV
jgi:branched-chain amino acid transport system ATP-binding protein